MNIQARVGKSYIDYQKFFDSCLRTLKTTYEETLNAEYGESGMLKEKVMKEIILFTDGACSGNPGPGGWGAVLALPNGQIKELGGHKAATTNNEMELAAVIQGIKCLLFLSQSAKVAENLVIYTDSTYVIRGITQWVWAWMRNDWKTAEGKEVSHQPLWQELMRLIQAWGGKKFVHWKYSRGHVGTPGNERCDVIAVAFSKKQYEPLYEGSLLQYSVAIYDLPEDVGLPEMRPKAEKKVAYSYLSLLGGQVVRHRDWASCERRVKGQSGAKFKKAMSEAEEPQILKEWGLSPQTSIKE